MITKFGLLLLAVGFSGPGSIALAQSLGTFTTRFKELVGMTPGNYQQREADATAGMAPCTAKQVTRPIRNREAGAPSRT